MTERTTIDSEHSHLGPSGADRWTTCEGSPNAEKGRPDETSIYAAAGTLYHKAIAECFHEGLDPYDYLNREYNIEGHHLVFTDEYARHMTAAIERIRALIQGGGLAHVETRVDISEYTLPGQFGTCDIGIVHLARREIIIWDNKWGEGVAVSPVENKQCMLYALGFWHDVARFAFKHDAADVKVRIIIDQPRARVHEPDEDDEPDYIGLDDAPAGGGEWVISMAELLRKWAPYFRKRAKATLDPNAPRTPSRKACQFCKARVDCKARAKFMMDMLRTDFDVIDESVKMGINMVEAPDPQSLTMEEKVFIALNKDFFANWLREVHASVLNDYLRGTNTPEVKAVRGRKGPRMWGDPQRAAKLLTKYLGSGKAYVKKLVSPTEAEKLLPTGIYDKLTDKAGGGKDSLVTQSEGRISLVHISDAREPIVPVRDQFADVDAEQYI